MKVHSFTIDSSQREPLDKDGYAIPPNDYTISLENPIYDVTQIKLTSARIPASQLLINESNQHFDYVQNGNEYTSTIPIGNYDGPALASLLNATFAMQWNATRNSFGMGSPPGGSVIFKFKTGAGGYDDVNNSRYTTPHQILGLPSRDVEMPGNQFGAANFKGPNSLILRISSGSEQLNQSLHISNCTPYYTGHILLDGSDFINVNSTDDKVTHTFHSGPLKYIKDLRIQFYYMSHGRLIPYDFRNQDHVLKFEITCSTDKLEGLPKVILNDTDTSHESTDDEKPINIPEVKNLYRWKSEYIYIILIVLIGILLMLFITKRRKYPRKISE